MEREFLQRGNPLRTHPFDVPEIIREVRRADDEQRWHWFKRFLEADVLAVLEMPAEQPIREKFSDPPGGWSRSLVRAYRTETRLHTVQPDDATAHHQGLRYVLLVPFHQETMIYLGWAELPTEGIEDRLRLFFSFLDTRWTGMPTGCDVNRSQQLGFDLEEQLPGVRFMALASGDLLVWRSTLYHQVIRDLLEIAGEEVTLLLTGETGVGKTLLARMIHEHSKRRDEPFVHVVVPTIPADLFASNLFGAVRGAYTDAVCDRTGFVALAEGGTLFLDEIAEIPPMTQATLLNIIEHRVYTVVGDARPRTCDVRWISATHQIRQVRSDLVYRLGEEWVHIPPLRERKEDILPIFMVHARMPVDDKVEAALLAYPWPGNHRELVHMARTLARRARRRNCEGIAHDLVSEELERRRCLN